MTFQPPSIRQSLASNWICNPTFFLFGKVQTCCGRTDICTPP